MKKSQLIIYLLIASLSLISCNKQSEDAAKKQKKDLIYLYALNDYLESQKCRAVPIEESVGTIEKLSYRLNDSGIIYNGFLYVPGTRIAKVDITNGATTYLAGSTTTGDLDGTGENARFTDVRSLAIDSSGNIFVPDKVDLNCKIKKITQAGVVTTLGTFTGPCYSNLTIDSSGKLYVVRMPFTSYVISFFNPNNNTSGTHRTLTGNYSSSSLLALRVNRAGTEFFLNPVRGQSTTTFITATSETSVSGDRVFAPDDTVYGVINLNKYGTIGKYNSNGEFSPIATAVVDPIRCPFQYIFNGYENKGFIFDPDNPSVFYYYSGYKITLK